MHSISIILVFNYLRDNMLQDLSIRVIADGIIEQVLRHSPGTREDSVYCATQNRESFDVAFLAVSVKLYT